MDKTGNGKESGNRRLYRSRMITKRRVPGRLFEQDAYFIKVIFRTWL
jgi:hypothetical protein